MHCYECAKRGGTEPAVAICWSCGAGLCLRHLHDAALDRAAGVTDRCLHDTWAGSELHGLPDDDPPEEGAEVDIAPRIAPAA